MPSLERIFRFGSCLCRTCCVGVHFLILLLGFPILQQLLTIIRRRIVDPFRAIFPKLSLIAAIIQAGIMNEIKRVKVGVAEGGGAFVVLVDVVVLGKTGRSGDAEASKAETTGKG